MSYLWYILHISYTASIDLGNSQVVLRNLNVEIYVRYKHICCATEEERFGAISGDCAHQH